MKAVIVDVAIITGQSRNHHPSIARAAPIEGAQCPIPVRRGRIIRLRIWLLRYEDGGITVISDPERVLILTSRPDFSIVVMG